MGNKRYDKLKTSFEASQPQLPDDFTNRVMRRVERKHLQWRTVMTAFAIAASIALVVLLVKPHQEEREQTLASTAHVAPRPRLTHIETINPHTSATSFHVESPVPKRRTKTPLSTDTMAVPDRQTETEVATDPSLHYATHQETEDTVEYQNPSRVDEFIAKMAAYNKVTPVPLNCAADPNDTTVVSAAYVFEDKEGLDLFGRLLQVACWYDCKTPGYLLNFSRQQLFFTLQDSRKQEKYLWLAERISNNRILLFCTHWPVGTEVSSDCYQQYRDSLTHTNSKTQNL